jgi:hypothetical protein
MAKAWLLMLDKSASVVVAGLVCREGVRSASRVVVRWYAGFVCRKDGRSASPVVLVWSAGLVCRMGVRSARLVVVELCVYQRDKL